MKFTFSLAQADAYARAYSLFWEFANGLRTTLGLQKGDKFDCHDVLDILNGYGFTRSNGQLVNTNEIVYIGQEADNPILMRKMGPWDEYSDGCTEYAFDEVKEAAYILYHRHWALVFAHGTDSVERNLSVAYKSRKAFFALLDQQGY